MTKTLLRIALTSCLVLLLNPTQAASREVLRLGIPANQPVEQLKRQWQPLADYLSNATPGYRVELQILDQTEMRNALNSNGLDFVLSGPVDLIKQRESSMMTTSLATMVRSENGAPVPVFGGDHHPAQGALRHSLSTARSPYRRRIPPSASLSRPAAHD